MLPFKDETIESFLLRISNAHKLPYRHFAISLSLPEQLTMVNLYHDTDKSKKLNSIRNLEDELRLPQNCLYDLTVSKSNKIWGRYHSSYQVGATNIPAYLYRKYNIPICPICIHELPYIPVYWHFETAILCSKHNNELIFNCPKCLSPISYIESEIIDRCSCGCNLSHTPIKTSSLKTPLHCTSEKLLGTLLFFKNTYNIPSSKELPKDQRLKFYEFYFNTKREIYKKLKIEFHSRKKSLTTNIKSCAFSEFWGQTILDSQNLPGMTKSTNMILPALVDALKLLSNEIDIPAFLSINEVSILLNLPPKDVKLAISQGKLRCRTKTLKTYVPTIDLREVLELV